MVVVQTFGQLFIFICKKLNSQLLIDVQVVIKLFVNDVNVVLQDLGLARLLKNVLLLQLVQPVV